MTQTLDRWAVKWRESKVAICEATQSGAQSYELLDVRMYCLEQRAREVMAMTDVFAEAVDEIVEHSVAAAHALADPHACTTVLDTGEFADRDLDPKVLEQVKAMDAELDRAYALAALAKYDESLPLQVRVVARAREVSHPWTLARALFDLSQSQFGTGDVEGGEASLREVIRLASELGDVEQEAEAWNYLIKDVAAARNRIAMGHAWALAAESALVRTGGVRHMKIRYEGALGELALADSKLDDAIAHYRTALALARAEYGEDHPSTIKIIINNAVALTRAEQREEAEKMLLEAVARSKEVYGPTHPVLAKLYFNFGLFYYTNEQFEQAEAALRSSFNIYERIGGSDAPTLGRPLHALGKVARELGRHDEALANLERATQIFMKSLGENSNEVAAAVSDLGVTQHKLGRYDDARASFDRVQAIYNVIYPDGHRHVFGLMGRRCAMFVDARLYADAVAACEVALEIAERFGLPPQDKRDVYQSLIAAENGRGRAAAVERAQEQLDEVLAEIAEAKAITNKPASGD